MSEQPLANSIDVNPHKHDGSNNTLTEGQYVYFPITTVAPTDLAPEGAIRLALIAGTYYLYARVNQAWKKVTLT
jgi:hypothetical protein